MPFFRPPEEKLLPFWTLEVWNKRRRSCVLASRRLGCIVRAQPQLEGAVPGVASKHRSVLARASRPPGCGPWAHTTVRSAHSSTFVLPRWVYVVVSVKASILCTARLRNNSTQPTGLSRGDPPSFWWSEGGGTDLTQTGGLPGRVSVAAGGGWGLSCVHRPKRTADFTDKADLQTRGLCMR